MILATGQFGSGCNKAEHQSKVKSAGDDITSTVSATKPYEPKSELLKKIIGNQEVKVGMDPTELP